MSYRPLRDWHDNPHLIGEQPSDIMDALFGSEQLIWSADPVGGVHLGYSTLVTLQ
jgi:hypothetical protein